MEDEFFLKKMKGVKAFKKDEKFIKIEKNKTKTEIKVEKNNATVKRAADPTKNKTDFKLTFGEINKESLGIKDKIRSLLGGRDGKNTLLKKLDQIESQSKQTK